MSKWVVVTVFALLLGVFAVSSNAAAEDAPAAPAPEAAAAPAAPEAPAPIIVPLDQMPQGVVAMVGDEKVTGAELDREMKRASRGGRPGAMAPGGQQKQVLDNLIDRRVITMLAKKAGVAPDPKEVDDTLAKQKANFKTEDEFKKRLEAVGLTEDDLRNMITEGTLQQKYVEQLTKDLAVSDDELKAKYEEFKAKGQLKSDETADVAHILVKVEGTDEAVWTEAKKKIDAARERVVKGEAFGDVAKEVSEDPGSKDKGGEYKGTKRGQMVPEFDQRTFSLPIGEVSEPFRTQYGWHILKVIKRTEAGDMAFDDIKDDLQKFMLDQKKSELVEGLIAKAKLETPVKMVELPEVPESAPQMMPMAVPPQQ